MRKGVNALEMIFTLFILIVVVLVIVRIFITRMNLVEIEKPVQDITDTYNYKVAESTCKNLCSEYEADCNTHSAVRFCLQKVSIDIDGNKLPGESLNHYNVVEGIPMCEDGIYCFHVKTNCACGSQILDSKTCLSVLCEYYQNTQGLNTNSAMNLIKSQIDHGTCPTTMTTWKGKIKGYTLIDLDPDPNNDVWLGPKYWYECAGYTSSNCTIIDRPNYCG